MLSFDIKITVVVVILGCWCSLLSIIILIAFIYPKVI